MAIDMMVLNQVILERIADPAVHPGIFVASLILSTIFYGIIKLVPPLIAFYTVSIIFLIKTLKAYKNNIPHLKVRLLFYGHISIYILCYIIFICYVFINAHIQVKYKIGSVDLVYTYYFIFIELLFFWTIYYHFTFISHKHGTPYVLIWPFFMLCFAIPPLYYMFGLFTFIPILPNNVILLFIVIYKVLYLFGWQLIIMYVINKYKITYHLRNLVLLIVITTMLLTALSLIVRYDINLKSDRLFQTLDYTYTYAYAIVIIVEMLMLFYLIVIFMFIHSDKLTKYLSYISIIICNVIVISYFMPFIDRMKIDYYIICPILLLNSVIISAMIYRFTRYLLKKLLILSHGT